MLEEEEDVEVGGGGVGVGTGGGVEDDGLAILSRGWEHQENRAHESEIGEPAADLESVLSSIPGIINALVDMLEINKQFSSPVMEDFCEKGGTIAEWSSEVWWSSSRAKEAWQQREIYCPNRLNIM